MTTDRLLIAVTVGIVVAVGLSVALVGAPVQPDGSLGTVALATVPVIVFVLPPFARYALLVAGPYAAVWIAILVHATGGQASPYQALFAVLLLGAALGSPHRRFYVTAGFALVGAAAPLLYDEAAVRHTATHLAVLAAWLAFAVVVHHLVGRLRTSQEQVRLLVENADDLLYRLSLRPHVRYDYLSPSSERVTGFTAEELAADPDLPLRQVHPEDLPRLLSTRTRPEDVEGEPIEFRWRRPDGREIWLEERVSPVRDRRGQIVAIAGILRDVTHRKEVEVTLRDTLARERVAAEKIRTLSDQKTAFLRAVSHEIRTPLAAVLGYTSTLRDHRDRLRDDQVDNMLDRLVQRSRTLTRIVNDLLDVDRLSKGAVAANLHECDLAEIVRRIVTETETAGRQVRLALRPVVARVDPGMVERIVENLVVNAVRHTPEGTPVTVRLLVEGTDVEIVVEDEGPGIPDELKADIFAPFRQGDASAEDASPGTGVGLALVVGLASLHGGRAWVDDRPGGGARFHVLLPDATRPPASPAPAASPDPAADRL